MIWNLIKLLSSLFLKIEWVNVNYREYIKVNSIVRIAHTNHIAKIVKVNIEDRYGQTISPTYYITPKDNHYLANMGNWYLSHDFQKIKSIKMSRLGFFFIMMIAILVTFIALSIFHKISEDGPKPSILVTEFNYKVDSLQNTFKPPPELTQEAVLVYIVKSDIKFPLIVFKQAMYETGWLKCKNCSLKYNNLFGFKTRDYLKFDHWTKSVDFYKIWQNTYYKEGDYYDFIKNIGYAEDPNYIKVLKSLKI